MLWEVVIRPAEDQPDREAERVLQEAQSFQAASIRDLESARSFLIQTSADQSAVERAATALLVDPVVETWEVRPVSANGRAAVPPAAARGHAINVLFKP
jgi:phosphoribosylformylglycinamidine synthase subunit PurSL